jgi:hypothetical protein
MKCLITGALGFLLAAAVGCEQKSGTAPSTNPANPGETRKITLTTEGSHSITQGGTTDVSVLVNRSHNKDDVTLDVNDLPKGVTLDSKDVIVPGDKNTITLRLKADPTAPPVENHEFHIVGHAKDIRSEPLNVKLTVKAKS